MIVGILKEIKAEENRVSMTPAGVEVMQQRGHNVLVEAAAGKGSGFEDGAYAAAGAEIVATSEEIYRRAEMVMHVKEPLPPEYKLIREDQIVFTYLHLAAAEELTRALIKSKAINIAYETIQKPGRRGQYSSMSPSIKAVVLRPPRRPPIRIQFIRLRESFIIA
jgi:alanine dehydrogenase